MRYVTIPKTDLRVSAVCMGTVAYGSTISETDSFAQLDRFVEQGGNFLDTARIYADWVPNAERSASEKTVGKWLQARGYQDSVIVATKGAHPLLGTRKPTMERSDLTHQIEESCRNLNLDRIPLYYLHRDDVELPVEYIMDTLFQQQDRGLLGNLGCSNWHADRIREANAYAESCGRTGFVAVSNRWSMAKCIEGAGDDTLVDMNEELYDMHRETGIAAIPFSSTAGGYLSKLAEGKLVRDSQRACYDLPENDALALRAKRLAAEKGVQVSQLAISYFYAQPFPAIPVTAFSNDRQMDEAIQATELLLTAEEYADLMGEKK